MCQRNPCVCIWCVCVFSVFRKVNKTSTEANLAPDIGQVYSKNNCPGVKNVHTVVQLGLSPKLPWESRTPARFLVLVYFRWIDLWISTFECHTMNWKNAYCPAKIKNSPFFWYFNLQQWIKKNVWGLTITYNL